MPNELTLTDVVSRLENDLRCTEQSAQGPERLRLLMTLFNLSLSNVVAASGRSISRSQLHRILKGQRPSSVEKRAIALGITACLRERCDSSFIFDGGNHVE